MGSAIISSRSSGFSLGHGWHSQANSLLRTNQANPPVISRCSLPGRLAAISLTSSSVGMVTILAGATDSPLVESPQRGPAERQRLAPVSTATICFGRPALCGGIAGPPDCAARDPESDVFQHGV